MRITPFLAVAAALLLAGCFPPVTTHPVGTTATIANDPALIGLWHGKTDQPADRRGLYFHFLPAGDNTITVVMVQAGSEPDGGWMVASITTAMLGGNHIMNAQLKFSDGKAENDDRPGTIPLLYRFEGLNRMVLYLMDEDATKAAIRAHKIAGTVEQGQFGDATITASPKDLDAFLATRKGAALFGERFATLTKME
ncbi:MAG: hypothetical protein JSR55_04775 [Proteobacteria bacterium]|nr:hypothetical protein [Pseudomonadota bacterium]